MTLRYEPYLLWRAVDQHGTALDILLQWGRDKGAAKRFFKRVLPLPRRVAQDRDRPTAQLSSGEGGDPLSEDAFWVALGFRNFEHVPPTGRIRIDPTNYDLVALHPEKE